MLAILSSFVFFSGLTFSSGPLTEELQCSVCLDVFTDPVTIPCGHNFCKSCLNQCWDKSEACCCPLCKETFSKRPDLKINTAFRQVVQLFKEKSCLTKPDVLCDICDERKLKALKSCLICQSSYSETHLEPHQRVSRLKKHKLINAIKNLEGYICKKHERPRELFCRDDQTFVCLSCTDGDHKTHNTVPLEEESEEKKTEVMKIQTEVQQIIQDRMKKIQDIKHSAELRKQNTEKEIEESAQLFMAMIRSIERCRAARREMMEQKLKAAEKQEEKLTKELQQEITELKLRNTELEQLSRTEDHLHLLQVYPSLRSPFNIKKWPDINVNTHPSLETLRKALTRLHKKLSENGN
ncbi:hypothetical protein PO909_001952 [Leuciscus waleckii]